MMHIPRREYDCSLIINSTSSLCWSSPKSRSLENEKYSFLGVRDFGEISKS